MSNLLLFPGLAVASPASDDAAVRELALDIHRSCIVEAPAGSGKTGLLVQRLLKLLAEADLAQPEEVLAITFTNKATAELRERVLHQLQQARSEPVPAADASAFDVQTHRLAAAALERSRRHDWHILDRPQRLNIRSIDSVCAEIANALPLLSGSGPRQPTENARPLYRLAARRTLLQLGSRDTPKSAALHHALRNVLLHRDGSLGDCEALLADMLATREQWSELVPLASDELDDASLDTVTRPRLERTLEAIVCAGLSRALQAMPAPLLHDLTFLAARLGIEPGYRGAPSPIALCSDRHLPPEAVAEHLDHWRALLWLLFTKEGTWRVGLKVNHLGFQIPTADKPILQQIIADLESTTESEALREALCAVFELPPSRYPEYPWQVAKSLFHVLRHALVELKMLFSERGECDFTEFALNARAALDAEFADSGGPRGAAEAAATDLALASGGHLRHLLVDEMQDTSSGQYDLIQSLTRSWDGGSQTLFLVGDPKQSIYLFRQARVERFLRTMREQRLGDIALRPLRLTANFRSQSNLVDGFNSAFHLLFPSPDAATSGEVPFVAATASRPAAESPGILWHATVLSDETKSSYNADEARTIRQIIEERLATPLPPDRAKDEDGTPKPWRVAILARARTHLADIVAEFKRDRGGGPLLYRAVDIDPLSDLPEVLDAVALTRALLHPADRVAWLAVLHAPWCGLGLADLLALTGEGPGATPDATVASLVMDRRAYLSEGGQRLLDRVWPILETAAGTVGRTPLSVHVERTWRSLGGDAYLSAEERNNVGEYIHLLRESEVKGPNLDLKSLEERLRNLYAKPMGGDVQVDLLTIHKAKGLEWDLVLVPGMHRQPGNSRWSLLNWLEVESNEKDGSRLLLSPIDERGQKTGTLNQWLRKTRSSRERAEDKRLFYVACTRAREELHLFAAATEKAAATAQMDEFQHQNEAPQLANPRPGTLLAACWKAARPHFAFPSTLSLFSALTLANEASFEQFGGASLDIAAAASGSPEEPVGGGRFASMVGRLPLSFRPEERFEDAELRKLPYVAAEAGAVAPAFERPEGSFGVRAFGNVVHRYLEVIARRLAAGPAATGPAPAQQADELLREVAGWEPRLAASLRGEGLAPAAATGEAKRALEGLRLTLADPVGRWILSPHRMAASEQSLVTATASLRVDRTFVAGRPPMIEASPQPGLLPGLLPGFPPGLLPGLQPGLPPNQGSLFPGLASLPFGQSSLPLGQPSLPLGQSSSPLSDDAEAIWIIDFKTTVQGSRSDEAFEAAERGKYAAQLEAYAKLRRAMGDQGLPIFVGLFYPLIPRLLHWESRLIQTES